MALNFYQNIYLTLSQAPEQVYLRWPQGRQGGGETASYNGREILDSVTAFRQLLQQEGVAQGQFVLLAVPVGFELICALLAIMAHGAVPVLPPARANALQLVKVLRQHRIKVILAAKSLSPVQTLLLRGIGVKIIQVKEQPPTDLWEPPCPVAPGQPALVSHSSGSTGAPKPVIRSHQVLQAQHQLLKRVFPPLPRQHDFPLFPNILLHNLSIGALSILPDLPAFDLLQMDPARLVRQLQSEGVQTLTGNVFYFNKLANYLEQAGEQLSGVQALGIGGSPVSETLLSRLRLVFPLAELYVIYGSSEAEPIAVRKVGATPYNPLLGYAVGPFCPTVAWRIVPIGTLATPPDTDGAARHTSAPLHPGEIEVRGAHVATHYPGSWLKTGDYGYLSEAGELFLTGRKGNETSCLGVQHYQLEHFLLHLKGVESAAAVTGPYGFTLYIQGEVDRALVSKALEANFPSGLVKELCFRKSLPVDSRHHSKIIYTKLR